jgi:hypothetical protein
MQRRKLLIASILLASVIFTNTLLAIRRFDPYTIYAVEQMPDAPNHYEMRNWTQVAADYDAFAFNLSATGQFLPIIQLVNNSGHLTFNIPAYIGRVPGDEAVACLASVLSASLIGINKSSQNGYDWVKMCDSWWSSPGIYVDNRNCTTGQSFWYEILPTIFIYQIAACYPQLTYFNDHIVKVADNWYKAIQVLKGDAAYPDFNYLAFNFSVMKPTQNGQWIEPDAAAGVAWLEYMAYLRSGDARFLTAARECLDSLFAQSLNPLYEILLPYGALLAARLNAEKRYSFDVSKLVNWCFGPSSARGGWGVVRSQWNGYDVDGLHGDMTESGGYVFAMNTFQNLGTLLPLARYEDRFATQIGKFALNVAANARYFYGNAWDDEHQDSKNYIDQYDKKSCVAYEALRKYAWNNQPGPFATGDLNRDRYLNHSGKTNLALYGSAHVGMLGGTVKTTNVDEILQFDLLRTDFYHDDTYPCYLYYNPYSSARMIDINVGDQQVDLYDSVSHQFVARHQQGIASISLPPQIACVLHFVPSGAPMDIIENHLVINGKVVDYSMSSLPADANFNSASPDQSILIASAWSSIVFVFCLACIFLMAMKERVKRRR